MRFFLDANVLFSAGKSDGAMRSFLTQLTADSHTLVADGYVVEEARRNLESKFPETLKGFEMLLPRLKISAGTPAPLSAEIAPDLPDKDRPVLAAAIHHACSVLLTGDKKDFGPLYGQTFVGVTIHSPASFAIQLKSDT